MNSENAHIRVLVAASGSGGHLFPALHAIQALKDKGAEVEFVGAGAPLEKEIIGTAEIPLHSIRSVKIKNKGAAGIIKFFLFLPLSLLQTMKIFLRFRPNVVLGVGGYATFMPVTIAFLLRVPRWIHEAELKPGLANSVLSLYSDKISVAFKEADMPRKRNIVFTGQPVRRELQEVADEDHPVSIPSKVLILGGSQGAHSLDMAAKELMPFFKLHGLSVWHQCRKQNYETLEKVYEDSGIVYQIMPFIRNLPEAYRWCDIIVSRAGAGAVMEIGMMGRPAIFVPYPHAQADHQTANAMTLVEEGKALLVSEGDGFVDRLRDALFQFLDREEYARVASLTVKERPSDGASRIADGCLELAVRQ